MRQKVTAAVIALVLGSFAAIGAFASQDKVDFGAAGRLFSSSAPAGATPGVDTPTSTATVDLTATATDTATPGASVTATNTPSATDTPSATQTAGPTGTPSAGCEEADDDHQSSGTPASGTPVSGTPSSGDDCDDQHKNNGKHEGEECGKGHQDDQGENGQNSGTPTAPAATATPDTSGTPTIVAQLPVHCHGEHGQEHDEGHHSGGNHQREGHDD